MTTDNPNASIKYNRRIYTLSAILWLFLVGLGITFCFHFALFTNPLTLLSLYSLIVTYTIYKFVRVLQASRTKALFRLNEYRIIENAGTVIGYTIAIISILILFAIGKKWPIFICLALVSLVPHTIAKYYLKKIRKLVEPFRYHERSYDLRNLSEEDAQDAFDFEQGIAKEDPQCLYSLVVSLQARENIKTNKSSRIINCYLKKYNYFNREKENIETDKTSSSINYYLEKAAQKGHAKSCLLLGLRYLYGYGIIQNDTLAFCWIQKAAIANEVDAQLVLASLYLGGVGIAQDKQNAYNWYSKAAHQNSTIAQYEFAWFLYYFASPEIDVHALEWLPEYIREEESAKSKFLSTEHSLLEQKQTDEVAKAALEWCLKSAEQENAKAQELLTIMYMNSARSFYDMELYRYWQRKTRFM